MKNKVLRLAIVAILVFAMVLSMAACGKKEDPTPSPTTSTTTPEVVKPTTPEVVEPTTPSTVKPSKVEDSVLAKEAFGIELAGFDKVYNAHDTAATAQYVVLNYDLAKVDNANYVVDGLTAWTGLTLSDIVDADKYTGVSLVRVNKAADGTWDEATDGDYMAVAFDKTVVAGTYEISIDLAVSDEGFAYAQYTATENKDETVEYTLEAVVNVAKADAVVTANSYVDKVAAAAAKVAVAPVADASLYTIKSGAFDVALSNFTDGTNTIRVAVNADSAYDLTTVGSYGLVVAPYENTGVLGADTLMDIEDIESDNYNISFVNGTQTMISAYDWNAVRDVATSIVELGTTGTAGDVLATSVNADKVALARARYDALTAEQQFWFTTGILTGVTPVVAPAYTTIVADTEINLATYETAVDGAINATSAAVDTGAAIYSYLTKSEVAAANYVVTAAFNKVVADAKLATYTDGIFNVKDKTHVNSYNTVNAYVEGLSDADLKLVKEETNYTGAYTTAKNAMNAADVSNVLNLIAGAVGAYTDAVTVPKTLYVSSGAKEVKNYINNAEVKALTSQARTAYDALDAAVQPKVAVALATEINDTYLDAGVATYKDALDALEKMNAVVAYMEQVVSYVNIEDYNQLSADASSPLYANLKDVIYGDNAVFATTTHNAMADILRAYDVSLDRYMDAVIAEYKAWIDTAIDFEDAKSAAAAEFKALVAEEYEDLDGFNANQLDEIAKGTELAKIITALMNETDDFADASDTVTITLTDGATTSTLVFATGKGADAETALKAMMTKDFAGIVDAVEADDDNSIANITEDLADYFDMDSALDAYVEVVAKIA